MPVLAALEPLAPQDPRSVGTFRLRARLGSGGMGQVYLGYSPAGRPVAVKVIHPELARDEQFRKRFRREVAAARKVNGAYTAPVIAAGPDDAIPWLATAYVAGPSVADAVAAAGPLPPETVLRLAGGLGEALAEIHATAVVHRDLKPSNVLLVADGPRVIDFGISRAVENSALTTTGLVVGTPGFMAPEQATGDEAGPASDIFSLGAVLVFAATGRAPFGDGSAVSVLFRVVHAEPDLDGIDGPLRDLISACMAKDPAARPTAGEIATLTQVSELADRAGAGGTAGTFWPSALDELIRGYADRADQVPPSGAGPAAEAGPRPPETETVRPVTDTGRRTDPSSQAMSGWRGGLPDHPQPSAAPSASPGRSRRPLLRRGVLAALVAVLVAGGVAAAIELPGGSKPGPSALPGTSASHAPTATQSAGSPVVSPSVPGVSHRPTPVSSGHPTQGTFMPSTPPPASEPAVTASPTPTSVRVSTPPPPVSAPPRRSYAVPALLGVPNWNGYCEETGQGPVTLVTADNAYGWHCTNATSLGDDANAVCAWTYKLSTSQVTNSVTNFYDPNTWKCWAATQELSAPDWNGYCQAQGLGTAVKTQNNAYGWYCAKSGNGLDAGTVCAWTNAASTLVIGRFQNFYDASTWQCWV
jgi:serine/threonine protein kinase